MNPLSWLGRIASSWSAYRQRENAYLAALNRLFEKYKLPPTKLKEGYRSYQYLLDDQWLRTAIDVINAIIAKANCDEETFILCGDLADFITVIGEDGFIYPCDKDGNIRPMYQQLGKMRGTDMFTSLAEMARGRGTDYALKLIQTELGTDSAAYHT